jgi:protein gp37
MSLESSGISWTDGTLNSLYGCSTCSTGCRLCYAVNGVYRHSRNARMNPDGRFDGLVDGGRFTGELLFDPRHLYAVLKEKTPRKIFVNEFSDLLHGALPIEVILEHVRVFRAAPHHQFQVLTKRSHRLAELDSVILAELGSWPANLWQGVSVCSATGIELRRIEHLGTTKAALKWVSFEPWVSNLSCPLRQAVPDFAELLRRNGIAWTVIGGESGARDEANLMMLDDARYLVEASKAAGCRVHFKQLGTALAIRLGVYSTRGGGEHRAKGGHPDQWPEELRIREWPEVAPNETADGSAFHPTFDPEQWMRFKLSQ